MKRGAIRAILMFGENCDRQRHVAVSTTNPIQKSRHRLKLLSQSVRLKLLSQSVRLKLLSQSVRLQLLSQSVRLKLLSQSV